MIRKPPEGWGRESAAVEAARTVAANGKAAVAVGTRTLRGLGLCAFGGLWTFAGLAAGLGGSLPTLIGAGALGLVTIAVGLRILRGPRAKDTPSPAPIAPGFAAAAGASATLFYDRSKLLAHAGFGVLVTLLALWGLGHFGGAMRLVMLALVPVFGLMTAGSARRAFGDLTALRWDRQRLNIRTLFSERDLAWSEVADIGVQQVNTYAYGFIKVASQRSLMVRAAKGGLFGGKVGISSSLLDLEGRTLEGLVVELQAAQAGRAAPAASAAAAPRPSQAAPSWNAPSPAAPVPVMSSATTFGNAAPRTFGRRGA